MIRIDHVTFSYGEENENAGGVHDINLTVEDGQCVVLCGESGSGKTTITRLINGLIPHYYEGKMNGEVWVNGEYSRAVTPQIRQAGNRLSGLAETAYASLLA